VVEEDRGGFHGGVMVRPAAVVKTPRLP
jgi:hypothetical protein